MVCFQTETLRLPRAVSLPRIASSSPNSLLCARSPSASLSPFSPVITAFSYPCSTPLQVTHPHPSFTHACHHLQAALEHTLTEEERRRNSRRLDQVYMLSSHPLAPDAFELADSASGLDESARVALSKPLDAASTGMAPA